MRINKNCVGCGNCVPFCSIKAITVYGIASISEEKCETCGRCIYYCPNDVIDEVHT